MLALDVDKDVLPLQQLGHRHRLVRHHAQRGLLEAVELFVKLADRG